MAEGDLNESAFCGGEPDTTNNRMELRAAIEALTRVPSGAIVQLYTDSQYVKNGITSWIIGWKKNGWRTAAKKPVKNADLWRELDQACGNVNVEWRWVKGHSGDPGNEKADQLANQGIEEFAL